MSPESIEIKRLIHGEVCMGTYGLVELALIKLEKKLIEIEQISKFDYLGFFKWLKSINKLEMYEAMLDISEDFSEDFLAFHILVKRKREIRQIVYPVLKYV